MKILFRRLMTVLFVAGVVGAIVYGLIPAPVEVDLATVEQGSIRVTVDQDGKTRIREKYVVSAPLAGRLQRIELEPGDEVRAGETLLASIEPRDPELLDARSIAQAEARVKAAEASVQKMEPILEEVEAAQEFAESELQRVREARKKSPQSISTSEIESKLLAYRTRSALLRTTKHNREISNFELDQARAALIHSRPHVGKEATESPESNGNGWNFNIRSPIDGRVLRVFQESTAVVSSGTPLLELGDPTDLEVEIDVLSRDAVKIHAGALVLLEHWGGEKTLQGRVRLVEPSAFTKISTLGVEEQRVNAIVDLVDPPQDRTALGDGFRVEARIIVSEATDVIKTPTSALFRVGDEWAVFRVVDGVAQQTVIVLGRQNGLEAEVFYGLSAGDQVVVHPGDDVADGTTVRAR
ncbi:MAG: HlyD family efflux transporter periplasmic adaptor subunit [Planctomycetes bacterium]|nr:HlyD family efflux transporter periplasmic adaptor subunit [Planctomycetota bacterium]